MANYETLEAARERILELEEEVRTITGERDTANATIETLNAQMEDVRAINQRYFNRLMQDEQKEEEEEKEPLSCEDFAKTLKI